MYKLLVVDDHPYQVDSIQQTIEQSELEIEVIYKTYSASEAIDILDRETVDIVITDIRMPEVSGIELIEHIRRTSNHIKCILLSGYADFEYAQQALELQTSKYLMKPVESGELINTIQTIIDKLKSEREAEQEYMQSLYTLRENLPLLRGGLLYDLLKGRSIPMRELTRKLVDYQIPMRCGDPFALIVLQLEDDVSGYNEFDVSLITYGVSNMAEEIFMDDFHVWHSRVSSRRLVLIVRPINDENGDMQSRLEKKVKELQRKIYSILKHIVSVGVVRSWGVFPEDLRAAYENGTAVFHSPEGRAAGFFASVPDLSEPFLQGSVEWLYKQPSLMILLETKRWDEVRLRLINVVRELELKSTATNEYVMEAFHVIAGSYQFAAHHYGMRLSDVMRNEEIALLRDHDNWNLRSFQEWAERSLESLEASVRMEERDVNPSLAKRIHSFIEAHLEEDLSLQSISEEVSLHPAYLSKIYKQETGRTLSDYLLSVRMEYSADLLKNTDCKIYEVSSKVGYQTPHYFIKVFKKVYGMTPQQYRNKVKSISSIN